MLDRDVVARTRRLKQSGVLTNAGSLQYVIFTGPVSMRAIVRTREELFTTTVAREAANFEVIVNGNYFSYTNMGAIDVAIGHDPINPANTVVEGRVVRAGRPTLGDSRPNHFFFAEIAEPGVNGRPGRIRYVARLGDPPANGKTVAALGGVAPLISNGLPYGDRNRYRPPTRGPVVGEPGPAARGSLTQRSNATFTSAERRDQATGKTVIAFHLREQALFVGVQPDGRAPGQTYAALRDALVVAGFSDAVFLDGSDSALMWYRGRPVVTPGPDKDELMTVGLGFRHRPDARRAE